MINQTSETTLVQGTVADAAMTVTLTDGAADIDLSSATIPRNYPGCKLTIKDSAGREIVGWIYTNGAGTVQNIVSTKGGSTRNWTYKNGSFDTTDDYTYRIDRVHVAALVHSGNMLAGLGHISTVPGTAFIDPDIGEDWSSFADGMHFLVVQDPAGRTIGGYLKAAGGGETGGGELIDGWTNDVAYPYETFTAGVGPLITQAINTAAGNGYGLVYKSITATPGALYKEIATVTVASGAQPRFAWGTGYGVPWVTFADGTTGGTYCTALAAHNRAFLSAQSSATDFALSVFSFQQITVPSATGATVVSAKSGTTYNWTWTTTGFDPNGALGFKIYKIGY